MSGKGISSSSPRPRGVQKVDIWRASLFFLHLGQSGRFSVFTEAEKKLKIM
jgi:hypothetical protein